MEAVIIILFFISFFLFLCLRSAFRKIYKLQEKIENLENISRSIKKVLLEKTTQAPNDIKLYKGLKGFEKQYSQTKENQKREGKKLFCEIIEKALLRYHYEKKLNDIIIELCILNMVKEINYLEFYALYEECHYSRENFTIELKRFFNDEIKRFGNDNYNENKKKFIEQAKTVLKNEKDQRILISLNSLVKSFNEPLPEASKS